MVDGYHLASILTESEVEEGSEMLRYAKIKGFIKGRLPYLEIVCTFSHPCTDSLVHIHVYVLSVCW